MRNRYHAIFGDVNVARSRTEVEVHGHEYATDR
jgi:hypothetical protein